MHSVTVSFSKLNIVLIAMDMKITFNVKLKFDYHGRREIFPRKGEIFHASIDRDIMHRYLTKCHLTNYQTEYSNFIIYYHVQPPCFVVCTAVVIWEELHLHEPLHVSFNIFPVIVYENVTFLDLEGPV